MRESISFKLFVLLKAPVRIQQLRLPFWTLKMAESQRRCCLECFRLRMYLSIHTQSPSFEEPQRKRIPQTDVAASVQEIYICKTVNEKSLHSCVLMPRFSDLTAFVVPILCLHSKHLIFTLEKFIYAAWFQQSTANAFALALTEKRGN